MSCINEQQYEYCNKFEFIMRMTMNNNEKHVNEQIHVVTSLKNTSNKTLLFHFLKSEFIKL